MLYWKIGSNKNYQQTIIKRFILTNIINKILLKFILVDALLKNLFEQISWIKHCWIFFDRWFFKKFIIVDLIDKILLKFIPIDTLLKGLFRQIISLKYR